MASNEHHIPYVIDNKLDDDPNAHLLPSQRIHPRDWNYDEPERRKSLPYTPPNQLQQKQFDALMQTQATWLHDHGANADDPNTVFSLPGLEIIGSYQNGTSDHNAARNGNYQLPTPTNNGTPEHQVNGHSDSVGPEGGDNDISLVALARLI